MGINQIDCRTDSLLDPACDSCGPCTILYNCINGKSLTATTPGETTGNSDSCDCSGLVGDFIVPLTVNGSLTDYATLDTALGLTSNFPALPDGTSCVFFWHDIDMWSVSCTSGSAGGGMFVRLSVIPGSPDQIQVVVRHDLISGGMFVAGGGCGTCTLTEDFSAFGGDFCASNPVTIPFSDAFGFGDCWSGGSDATITLAI